MTHRILFSRFIPTFITLCIAIAVISAPILGQSPAAAAKGGNSANAKSCQKGGWQQLMTADGVPFSNQDECVSAGAKGTVIVPLVPTQLPPTDVPAPPTETPLPPTDTPVPPTEVPTETPSPVPTDTPMPTATETTVPTETPIPTATPSPTPVPQPSIQVTFAPVSGDTGSCQIGAVLSNFQPSTSYQYVEFWIHSSARPDTFLWTWSVTTDANGAATSPPQGTPIGKQYGYSAQVRVGSVVSAWVPISC